jgi:ferredoxin/flavodoxin---NADP+ reductase
LILRAIGYFGQVVPGLPFDDHRGVIPNQDGRVVEHADETPIPGAYVVGWIKRGPSGIIGTNKKCARDTVRSLIDDARAGRLPIDGTLGADEVACRLTERAANVVTYQDWKSIDHFERRAGQSADRPRVKLATIEAMLEVAAAASSRESPSA